MEDFLQRIIDSRKAIVTYNEELLEEYNAANQKIPVAVARSTILTNLIQLENAKVDLANAEKELWEYRNKTEVEHGKDTLQAQPL
jgi:hypothetical protein